MPQESVVILSSASLKCKVLCSDHCSYVSGMSHQGVERATYFNGPLILTVGFVHVYIRVRACHYLACNFIKCDSLQFLLLFNICGLQDMVWFVENY